MAGGACRIRGHREFRSGKPGPQSPRCAHDRAAGQELRLGSTVGILHDRGGRLQPLAPDHLAIYRDLLEPDQKMFSFAQYDRFQRNISEGRPNQWHCCAGGRFLYICEDGGEKPCAPFCTVSWVHQTAMLDTFRESPRQVLSEIIAARLKRNPSYRPPAILHAFTWAFLDGPLRGVPGNVALRILRARS